jgi:hypothetical protein
MHFYLFFVMNFHVMKLTVKFILVICDNYNIYFFVLFIVNFVYFYYVDDIK